MWFSCLWLVSTCMHLRLTYNTKFWREVFELIDTKTYKSKYEQRFGQRGHIKSNYILEMWDFDTQKNVLCWNCMCINTKCQLFYVYVICLVLDSSIDFDNIHRVTIRIIYVLCFLFVFCLFVCFVCLHSVYCVPNGASFSGLFIIDCFFGFL